MKHDRLDRHKQNSKDEYGMFNSVYNTSTPNGFQFI